MTYNKQIDSFRFFAAFSVLTAHWLHFVPGVEELKLGFIGVDFFFVLSGFLISYQLLELSSAVSEKKVERRQALKNFIIRRALRIFPLYYLVLLAATLFNKGEIREAFLYNLTYTSNFYFIKVQHWTSIFSHFWSLSVEEHFYLVWPLFLVLLRRKTIPLVIGLVALGSIVFRYFSFTSTYDYFTVYAHTLSCLDVFMFGAVLAYFLHQKKEAFLAFFSNRMVKYAMISGLLLSYLTVLLVENTPIFTWVFFRAIFGFFSAGLVGLLVIGFKGNTKKFLEHKWLVLGGKLSYAIYLLHNFVPGILLEMKKLELPTAIEFLLYFIATFAISYLLHKFIETPIRKLGQKFKIHYS